MSPYSIKWTDRASILSAYMYLCRSTCIVYHQMLVKMNTSSDPPTSKVLCLSRTNNFVEEIIDCNAPGEPLLAILTSNLVHEWLDQALDNYQFTFGSVFCRSDSCTRNGNHNENQATNISSDTVVFSVPSLKQLCCEALETSDNHLTKLSNCQFYSEEKQAHGRHINGNETFLCDSTKEIQSLSLESDCAGNHSRHNSASSSLKVCDFSILFNDNFVITDTDRAELNAMKVSHGVLHNVNVNDETMDQIQTRVCQPSFILNFAVEAMSDSFNSSVKSNLDCTSAHTHGLINSQDRSENIACRLTNSSSDTFSTDDWNSMSDGNQICLFGPEVQVSIFATLKFRVIALLFNFTLSFKNNCFQNLA